MNAASDDTAARLNSPPPGGMGSNAPDAPAVDDQQPWIGLASFTEETRDYFYGREEEVAELARRVQRKLLTILFGQSGLGKTSILRAGLVPRLRGHGYCPIYVRIDYSSDAPDPAEQIKRAIQQTARRSGQWTQVGVAVEGETLWEFLHHRDDVLLDEAGKPLIPLLIFDQFEEIFTLAQTDEAGRARAARFVADLADLVENRPPASVEAKLDADDSIAERFDFARGDYRVLIALREDYLAPLEGFKSRMPSITQNRLRLAPMTGTQGLQAVLRPGKNLVSQEVAEAIVRFVAGGSEIANAEVEPSLLSLVCRELNDTRIAQGRDEISLDLLAGSHDAILSNFYERALADQPPAVRRTIEDELLTESGFRENIAEERLRTRFAAAGVTHDALAELVNRRLLRIEERLDIRRVELTHDVLCGVVKSSRDLRHEREAREATEQRERAARHSLVRARQVAAVCIILAIGAVIAAVLAYLSTQRAKRAEGVAIQSRTQAERLLGYLTQSFARELEDSGRLDVIISLAKQEMDYFHALPEELKGADTKRTAAMAMTQFALASRKQGKLDEASAATAEAKSLLEGLQRQGDRSEATTLALVRATGVEARIMNSRQDPRTGDSLQQAVEMLRPLSDRPDASLAVREAQVEALNNFGFFQTRPGSPDVAKGIDVLRKSMSIAASHGALGLENFYMAGKYAEAAGWLVGGLAIAGRNDEASRVADEGSAVADKVLMQRPEHRSALFAKFIMTSSLADVAYSEMRLADATALNRRAIEVQKSFVRIDPNNAITLNNLATGQSQLGDEYWYLGRPREAMPAFEDAITSMRAAARGGLNFLINEAGVIQDAAWRYVDLGDIASAERTLRRLDVTTDEINRAGARDVGWLLAVDGLRKRGLADIALARGDARTAASLANTTLSKMQAAFPPGDRQHIAKALLLYTLADLKARANLQTRDFAAAEDGAREALEAKKFIEFDPTTDSRQRAIQNTMIALSLVSRGRTEEARQEILPVVKLHRELARRNHDDALQPVELASALYVQALTEPGNRNVLLRESAALFDRAPAPVKALHSVRVWRERVREAMH